MKPWMNVCHGLDQIKSKAEKGSGLSYEEALSLLENPILHPLKSQTTSFYEIETCLLNAANNIDPSITLNNSLYAWYCRAMRQQNVPVMEIAYYSEDDTAFIESVLEKVKHLNPVAISNTRNDPKWTISFYRDGFWVNTTAVKGSSHGIIKYKDFLFEVGYIDAVGFDFTGCINKVDAKQAEEIRDVFILLERELTFFSYGIKEREIKELIEKGKEIFYFEGVEQ